MVLATAHQFTNASLTLAFPKSPNQVSPKIFNNPRFFSPNSTLTLDDELSLDSSENGGDRHRVEEGDNGEGGPWSVCGGNGEKETTTDEYN